MTKSYGVLGILLTIIGLGVPVAYYYYAPPAIQAKVPPVPLIAVSVLAVILGLTSIFLAFSKPSMSPSPNQQTRRSGIPIIILAATLVIINVILILTNQDDLAIYFILDSIAYIVITLFYTSINHRSVSALNKMSAIIFIGFIVTVAFKLIVILD